MIMISDTIKNKGNRISKKITGEYIKNNSNENYT